MTRHVAITEAEMARIIALLVRKRWNVRQQSGPTTAYVGYPPNSRYTPVTISGREGALALYRELRQRGVEVDPRRLSTRKRKTMDRADLDALLATIEAARYEPRPTKPLPATVSEWARGIAWDTHAIDRVQEHGVGVFEVYAALDFPDYTKEPTKQRDRRRQISCYYRGDVIVVLDITWRRILTVVAVGHPPGTRTPLHPHTPTPNGVPEMAPAPTFIEPTTDPAAPSEAVETPRSEQPEPDPQQSDTETIEMPEPKNQSQQIFAYLAAQPRNFTFTTRQLHAQLPTIPLGTITSAINRAKGIRPEVIRPTPVRGEYRVWDRHGLAKLVTGRGYTTAVIAERKTTAVATGKRRESGRHPGSLNPVRELIASLKPGDEITTPLVSEMLGKGGPERRSIRSLLDEYETRGVLTSRPSGPGRTAVRIFRLADTDVPEVASAIETVPADQPAIVVTTLAAPVFEPDDDDAVDVSVGFAFEALLASDIYDMAELVREHYAELREHPGGTFRLAEYGGTDPLGIAEKRAVLLADHLDDGCLQFVARRRGERHAGLYVSWRRG